MMAPKTKILVIDDDSSLGRMLEKHFSRVGFRVVTAQDGLQGLRLLFEVRPDLVVLDTDTPGIDGWQTCQRIRAMSALPIIMIGTERVESGCIRALQLGADDYLPKPLSFRELEARIEAILRRTMVSSTRQRSPLTRLDEGLVIDMRNREVRRNGDRVELTSTEARLLFFMADNAGHVLSHRELLEQVWGPEYVDNSDYTKLFIWRLRQKIEPDPRHPRYILTERGVGYRMIDAKEA
jgi:DNA-binding response OmpR family regulator